MIEVKVYNETYPGLFFQANPMLVNDLHIQKQITTEDLSVCPPPF